MIRTALVVVVAASLLTGCKKKVPEPTPEPTISTAPADRPISATPEHVKAMKASFEKVFFEFDQDGLTEEGKTSLRDNAKIMTEHPDVKLEIQGHADERGTTEYNLALGQRRAETVKTFLLGLGVPATRVSTITYGEERPAVKGNTEVVYEKNRRAEFRITWGGSDAVTGTVQ